MSRSRRRLIVLSLALWLALATGLQTACVPLRARAEGPHQAGLLVDFGQGRVFTTCVTFSEDQLSGVEILRRSGLEIVVEHSGIGQAVCKIGDVGCNYPASHCFCECLRTPCNYWSYWYLAEGVWVYSGMGGSDRLVTDGQVDAWVWGDGSRQPGEYGFDDLCVHKTEDSPDLAQRALTVTRFPAPPGARLAGRPVASESPPAKSAREARTTPAPPLQAQTTPGPSSGRPSKSRQDYGAFGAIVGLLLLGIAYASLTQRRRYRLTR